MRKEIEFLTKFDTSEFDRSVEIMQRKLREVYRPSDIVGSQRQTAQRLENIGLGGNLSKPTMEAFQKSVNQTRRDMDKIIADEAKNQEKLAKDIAKRAETLQKMRDQQKDMVKGSKEELEIREKISRVEENQYKLRESYKQRDQTINQAIDARERLGGKGGGMDKLVEAYRTGGLSGIAESAMKNLGRGGMIAGAAGAGLTALGAGIGQGAELYRDFSRAPIRTDVAMGSAVSGTMGKATQDIYGRRTAFENIFSPERARAAKMANEAAEAQMSADKWGLGGAGAKALGMGVAGATGGAAIGSVIPGLGTLAGGIVGGVGGLGKGLYDIMGNERQRSLALSPFSDTQKKRYQSIIAEQLVKDYSDSYEAQKKQNPFKQAAAQEYEQNFQGNLDMQRMLGLNNEQFYGKGGFQQRTIDAGFTPEMGNRMAQGIIGAGGSSRMAGDAAFGLQAERGLNLSNASQVLGTLSGGIGGAGSSKEAMVKIMAEGMKLGLDGSEFAEEQRKFAQISAEYIQKSGASTGDDFERIAAGFGRFMAQDTNKGLDAAKSAYEQYQQISSTTTGARGVMRAAGFMGDEQLGKLSTMTKQALMKVPEQDLNETNPLVQAAANESGVSAKEIVARVSKVNQGAVSRFGEADQIRDRIRGRMKELGMNRLSEKDIQNLPEDMRNDLNKLATFQTVELGYQGQREATARMLGTVNPMEAGGEKQLGRENIIQDKLTSVERTGRMEDVTVKAMAADSKVVLDNFNEMAPAMKKAAESAAAYTREVREMNAALMRALEDARANKGTETLKTLQDVLKQQENFGKKNQTQSGKPKQ